MKKTLHILILCCIGLYGRAQFAPPAGQVGTTAMYKDSSVFISWVNKCKIIRGPQDISTPSTGLASVGDSTMALGKAGTNGVVSLGDRGTAILQFNKPITNGNGYDFAVFENSFSDDYLEFAFVEVSSDGNHFVRFPSTSNIQDTVQCDPFGLSDTKLINNLAGKYRASYGTPFDLDELKDSVGLDVTNITHIKIIDVVGSLQNQYATYDKNGHKINEPWPTAFASSGFDLDAVGVIHESITSSIDGTENNIVQLLYPNPCTNEINLLLTQAATKIYINNLLGETIVKQIGTDSNHININTQELSTGIYYLNVQNNKLHQTIKFIKE